MNATKLERIVWADCGEHDNSWALLFIYTIFATHLFPLISGLFTASCVTGTFIRTKLVDIMKTKILCSYNKTQNNKN